MTSLLMDRRPRCIQSNDVMKAPIERFKDFVHHIACKNTNKSADVMANQNP